MVTSGNVLSGVRVVEYASGGAAPYSARILADLGADVVKVEPLEGDSARWFGADSSGTSGLFEHANAGKRGIGLDVRTATGEALFASLLSVAECVVLDETTAWVMDRAPLLSAITPGTPIVVITPYGLTGPRSHFHALAPGLFHAGGEGVVTPKGAETNSPPVAPTANVAWFDAGAMGAYAALLAFFYRGTHRERAADAGPAVIDISIQDVLVCLGRLDLCAYPNEGRLDDRIDRGGPLLGLRLPCSDGEVLTLAGEAHWKTWCEVTGLTYPEEFATVDNRDQITKELGNWTRLRTRAEVEAIAQPRGIPAAGIRSPREVLSDDQLLFREFFKEWPDNLPGDESGRRRRTSASLPVVTDDGARWLPQSQAPTLGQHTSEICRELGYTTDEVVALFRSKVVR